MDDVETNTGIDIPARFVRGYRDVVVTLPEEAKLPDGVTISFRVNAPGARQTDRFIVLSRTSGSSFVELPDSKGDPDNTTSTTKIRVGAMDTLVIITPDPDEYVNAKATAQQVTFTYRVPDTTGASELDDMADGQLQISLPPGWSFAAVPTDGTIVPNLTTDTTAVTAGTAISRSRMKLAGTTATVMWDDTADDATEYRPNNPSASTPITFYVNVPSGRTSYTFVAMSKTRFTGDALTNLDTEYDVDPTADPPTPNPPGTAYD